MDQPLVSIILPVYNAQNHLARCIGSILNQTYKNIELIILNDGSKDHSLPVCEEFRARDSRIVLVDKENSGVSDTRNLGLKLAGGEYVQFVDSDDYIDPDFTQHLVEAAETHHADLVIAPYKMVIPAGATKPEQVLEKLEDNLGVMSVARPPEVREYGFLPAGVYDKDTFALRLMDKPASYFYSVLWNKLYRRDILTRHDIRFTSDHPALLGALGMMPDNKLINKRVMAKTLDWIWDNWNWDKTWGWDYPMVAMTCARLGQPSRAIDALLMNKRTNTYLVNGHNYQDGRLRVYMPGNGGLLTAVAMMCAGWDGATTKNPGFPKDWNVKWEGLLPMP